MTMTAPLPVAETDRDARVLAAIEAEQGRSFGLALRLLGNEADARDALQEAWVRAWRARESWRTDSAPGAWLRAIVVRECYRTLRWRGLRAWLPFGPEQEQAAVEPDATDTSDASRIRTVVRDLPLKQRVAFTLRFEEEWTIPEIAVGLGVGPETVKTHLARALERVRAALGAPPGL
jgi:RNA polymerase sigma-70 factor (ECF subfamily)